MLRLSAENANRLIVSTHVLFVLGDELLPPVLVVEIDLVRVFGVGVGEEDVVGGE